MGPDAAAAAERLMETLGRDFTAQRTARACASAGGPAAHRSNTNATTQRLLANLQQEVNAYGRLGGWSPPAQPQPPPGRVEPLAPKGKGKGAPPPPNTTGSASTCWVEADPVVFGGAPFGPPPPPPTPTSTQPPGYLQQPAATSAAAVAAGIAVEKARPGPYAFSTTATTSSSESKLNKNPEPRGSLQNPVIAGITPPRGGIPAPPGGGKSGMKGGPGNKGGRGGKPSSKGGGKGAPPSSKGGGEKGGGETEHPLDSEDILRDNEVR